MLPVFLDTCGLLRLYLCGTLLVLGGAASGCPRFQQACDQAL